MKRALCIILALAMLTVLVACGGGNKGLDYLVLVNKENKLPDDWEARIETATFKNSVGDDVEVEKKAYEAYLKLKDALAAEGVFVDLDSARRSVATQQEIWDNFMEKYGEVYTKRTVATPGYSEHHTGLALDLYLIIDGEDVVENEDMIQYPEIWAKIHAKLAQFGFILRYPEGKEAVTGYGYEPWHIRYVDSPAIAREITEKEITLEEYLGKLPVGNVAPPAEEEETAETVETADGSGQNSVMNFIGRYDCDRAHALVEASGADGVRVTIRWSGSADTTRQWEIEGTFDKETLTVNYRGASVKNITYNEDGSVKSEELVTEEATGSLIFRENGSFLWNDDLDGTRDMEFVWSVEP